MGRVYYAYMGIISVLGKIVVEVITNRDNVFFCFSSQHNCRKPQNTGESKGFVKKILIADMSAKAFTHYLHFIKKTKFSFLSASCFTCSPTIHFIRRLYFLVALLPFMLDPRTSGQLLMKIKTKKTSETKQTSK